MSLCLPDRALLVKLFYQNDNSTIVAQRKFRTLKGLRKGPLTAKNLRLMVTKFEETGSLNVRSGRGKKPVSAEAIEKVALQEEEDKSSNVLARTSVRRVAEALDPPRSTVQKIMRNILRYYPYKLQFVQELLPHDFETRHLFSLQFLARLEVDPEWPWNILWADEAHFHLDGSVNTHNCRIWKTDNPHSTLRIPLHSLLHTIPLHTLDANGVVWVFHVFYSWPVFFRGIRCWSSRSASTSVPFTHNFYARWSSSTHYTLCYGHSQTSLHRRTCDQPPISSSVASPIT
ncbi:uncharacterized protein TNCV_1072541 [Trichonephila clavipes]|nr:uncharacterized protein TNCV_1072541 [Trichonephila clavipes]